MNDANTPDIADDKVCEIIISNCVIEGIIY